MPVAAVTAPRGKLFAATASRSLVVMDELPDGAADISATPTKLSEALHNTGPNPVRGDVSMGMESLDRSFNGGLPPGSLVVLEFPAGSPGEEIAHGLAGADQHSTLYLSLNRPTPVVEADVERAGGSSNAKVVYMGDEHGQGQHGWLHEVLEFGEGWTESTIVVDTYTDYALEFGRASNAIAQLSKQIRSSGGVMYLLVHPGTSTREAEIARRAKHLADIVFEYHRADDADQDDQLIVPKMRRRQEKPIKLPLHLDLEVEDQVSVSHDASF